MLASANTSRFTLGSVVLTPPAVAVIAAQLSVINRNPGINDDVEEEFLKVPGLKGARFRAAAASSTRVPAVAIFNAGNAAQVAVAECRTGGGMSTRSNVQVAPGQTQLISACIADPEIGLISLANLASLPASVPSPLMLTVTPEAAGATLASFAVGLQRLDSGVVLSALPLVNIIALRSSTAVFPVVPARQSPLFGAEHFTVAGAIANFGGIAKEAKVFAVSNGISKVLATVTVPPSSVLDLNLGDTEANSTYETSLMIKSDGQPGDLVAQVEAVADAANSVLRIPLPWKDLKQIANGGQHPWRLDQGYSSTLVLSNPDQLLSNSVIVNLLTDRSHWTKSVDMAPNGTLSIRIDDVIAKQLPDDSGVLLPRSSLQGIATWFSLADPKVFGVMIETDPMRRIARPFGCFRYQVLCDVTVPSFAVAVGQSSTTFPLAWSCGTNGGCSCGTNIHAFDPGCIQTASAKITGYTWSSSDPSVAKLTSVPSSPFGTYLGVLMGTTYANLLALDNMQCFASNYGTISVACGNPPDDRDTIIPQYKNYGVDLTPKCADFTQSTHSVYFAFSELHKNDYYSWALLSAAFLGPSSQGYGLDSWRVDYGSARVVNSVYRSPLKNAAIKGASNSRHMHRDAADFNNASGTMAEWMNMLSAARMAARDWEEPITGPCGVGCAHADWRYHSPNVFAH